MSLPLLVSLVGTFFAVALLAGAAAYTVMERQAPGRKRLQEAVKAQVNRPAPTASALEIRPSPRIERLASFVPKSPEEMNRLRLRFIQAGYHSLTAAVV